MVGMNGCGKSRPHRCSTPGLSNPWRVAIPTVTQEGGSYEFCWGLTYSCGLSVDQEQITVSYRGQTCKGSITYSLPLNAG